MSEATTIVDRLRASLERVVNEPAYHDALAVVKGARNGAVYGAKVRFPHALVMVFLFRQGSLRDKAGLVLRATRTHARNLAKFAAIYKAACFVLKHYGATPGKEGKYDTFLAGLLGGYAVFGGRSPRTGKIPSVNQQIVVYVFARVVLALAKLAVKPTSSSSDLIGGGSSGGGGNGSRSIGGLFPLPFLSEPATSATVSHYAWPVFAAASWAAVMHLFRWHPDELQSSLRSSMNYIYTQADEWDGLRNFIWHNR